MMHDCEEIHVYAGTAERTGVVVEMRGMVRRRACTSMRDLIRKYKLFGDGHFYLPVGQWPVDTTEVSLDNVKWLGMDAACRADRREDEPVAAEPVGAQKGNG
jgi:hypothetical protein